MARPKCSDAGSVTIGPERSAVKVLAFPKISSSLLSEEQGLVSETPIVKMKNLRELQKTRKGADPFDSKTMMTTILTMRIKTHRQLEAVQERLAPVLLSTINLTAISSILQTKVVVH